MKKDTLFILYFLLVFCTLSFSQNAEIRKYETFDLFLSEQNEKVSQVAMGFSQHEVEAIFGSSIRVQIPKVGKMKPLDKLFKQPEFKNVFKPNTENEVVVLWYFTTPKDENGYITKTECTPIIFVADKVIGIGWDDFKKARKDGTLR